MSKKTAGIDDRLDEAIEESFPASDPPSITPEPVARDNANLHRFEAEIEGHIAVLDYARAPGSITLVQTKVPEAIAGRGVEDVLARFALNTARREVLKVKVECKDVKAFVAKNPEYARLVDSGR